MTAGRRRAVVLACAAVAAAFLVPAVLRLGRAPQTYGAAVVPISLHERSTSNVAGVVAYDVRGFDTLGEEFILLAAVVGVGLLQRPPGSSHPARVEPPGDEPSPRVAGASRPTVRRVSADTIAISLVFGIYMVMHATVSPGGGFQGGAIIASAFTLLYLGWDYGAWSRLVRETPMAIAEAVGVGVFIAAGLVPLLGGRGFLVNWLPVGKLGRIGSGGTMFAINLGIGLAVAAGFALILRELLRDLHTPGPEGA